MVTPFTTACATCGVPTSPEPIRWERKYCDDCRPAKGGARRRTLGDRYMDTYGYIRVATPDGVMGEHTLVMQQALGRSLRRPGGSPQRPINAR